MTKDMSHVHLGFAAVRPYLYGPTTLLDLVCGALGGVEVARHVFGEKVFHLEVQIADSIVVLELSDPPHAGGRPAATYVYVPDVDAVYAKALSLGAQSISAPADKPYHERAAAMRDAFGNIWYVSTYTGG
jgi:PhnB protein